MHSFTFLCSTCGQPLERADDDTLRCPKDGAIYPRRDGIWHLLSQEQLTATSGFLDDYQRLRHDEGWTVGNAAYYQALPYRDLSGRHPEIWRIRAASFDVLKEVVGQQTLNIADLGAGNGWLSHRLATSGHNVVALDLSLDPDDGLGATSHYCKPDDFVRVQAGFEDVPLADHQFDLVIFNGSLHYATSLQTALSEATRLLRQAGRIVVMDSPVYRRDASGRRMLGERQEAWHQRYGNNFGASPAEGFLTRRKLRDSGSGLALKWRFHPLPLGWRWRLGPFVAVALGRREPARFPLVVGQLS